MIDGRIAKYFWLIQTISRSGELGLSLREIQERWERRWGENYSRRTFNNHRILIEDTFGVVISCGKGSTRYVVLSGEDDLESNNNFKWMMDSMALSNLSELKQGPLKGRIAIETVPKGRNNLISITAAMQENLKIRISYQKYSSKDGSVYTIHPYALKENSRRWYLVGFCEEKRSIRVYALDRIQAIDIALDHFEMPADFDVDDLFAGCFGVYLPDEGDRRKRIVFRVTSSEAKYLLDLPIHESQKIVSRDDESVTFEIYVFVNQNLIMEFLSRGSRLEILEPSEFRESIKQEITKTQNLYD